MDKQGDASGMDSEVDEWITSEDKKGGRSREERRMKGKEQRGKGEERLGELGWGSGDNTSEEGWERDTVVAAGMVAPLLSLH